MPLLAATVLLNEVKGGYSLTHLRRVHGAVSKIIKMMLLSVDDNGRRLRVLVKHRSAVPESGSLRGKTSASFLSA